MGDRGLIWSSDYSENINFNFLNPCKLADKPLDKKVFQESQTNKNPLLGKEYSENTDFTIVPIYYIIHVIDTCRVYLNL